MKTDSTVFVYSDSSFSRKHGFGIGGYLIFGNNGDHDAGEVGRALFVTEKIIEKNNIRVELKTAIMALAAVESIRATNVTTGEQGWGVCLYTDCEAIVGLLKRRNRLEASRYMSKQKGERLANADLYRAFFTLCDRLHPRIHWLKGHSPLQGKSTIDKNFSYVDKAVRAELRRRCPAEPLLTDR